VKTPTVTHRPCSVAGKLPWANVPKEDAKTACELIGSGWSLCDPSVWQDACNGSTNTTFPYGAAYDGAKCNGHDYPKGATVTTLPSGNASFCISYPNAPPATDQLFDMSGNVKEWAMTATATATCTSPPCFEIRGGAYDIASFIDYSVTPSVMRAPGLQCDASTPAPADPVVLPSVGFRCCHAGTLPP
jgi:formylglycine-generating enzyme required for sulfatase activity